MNALAIVPARAGSQGLVNKNLRLLGGKTLVRHAVDVAMAAGLPVVVTTDIPRAQLDLPDDWPTLVRPPELATSDTPMIDVVQHVLAALPGPEDQILVLLQPTQPLRTAQHVQAAIALLGTFSPEPFGCPDSVVSVVAVPAVYAPEWQCEIVLDGLRPYVRPNDGSYRSWREWSRVPPRRQDVPTRYRRDGTVYACWRRTVDEFGTIYGQDVKPLIIPPEEMCECDTEADWAALEARWGQREA